MYAISEDDIVIGVTYYNPALHHDPVSNSRISLSSLLCTVEVPL